MHKTEKYWVLEGEWGGQVYLTVPMEDVAESKIAAALVVLDAPEWDGHSDIMSFGASYYTISGSRGADVWGDLASDRVTDGLWLDERLMPSQKKWVQDFFSGKVGLPSPEEMLSWLTHEARRWQWLNKEEVSAKMWWKKFHGQLRRAQKVLDKELPIL